MNRIDRRWEDVVRAVAQDSFVNSFRHHKLHISYHVASIGTILVDDHARLVARVDPLKDGATNIVLYGSIHNGSYLANRDKVSIQQI